MSILNEVLKLILQTVKAKKKKQPNKQTKNLPRGDINEGRNKKESIMKEVRLGGIDLSYSWHLDRLRKGQNV